jgi:hypothetical protein
MSNEIVIGDEAELEDITSDLRADDLKDVVKTAAPVERPKPFVKPTVHVDIADTLTPEQIVAVSKLVATQTKAAFDAASYDPSRASQAVRKSVVPITDFSKMTLADVYDLSIPIEAKPFMSADVLAIRLKDTNFEARWVNKNSQRLGEMLGKGFTYITDEDLVAVEGIQTTKDAEGHYSVNDVVAMKIDKATYFAAQRAAHIRALSITSSAGLAKKAVSSANAAMQRSEFGNDFTSAQNSKKMEIYDAGISI